MIKLGDEQTVTYTHHRHRVRGIVEAIVQVQGAVDNGRLDIQLEGIQHSARQCLVVAVEVRTQERLAQFRQALGHVNATKRGHRAQNGLRKGHGRRPATVVAPGFDEIHGAR